MYGLSNGDPNMDLKVKGNGKTEKNFEVEYLENGKR